MIQVVIQHGRRLRPLATKQGGVLQPEVAKQFFKNALTTRAICIGPLAKLSLLYVAMLADAIAATALSQRVNGRAEIAHAASVDAQHPPGGRESDGRLGRRASHTAGRRGAEQLSAMLLGKKDDEFTDTLRLARSRSTPLSPCSARSLLAWSRST